MAAVAQASAERLSGPDATAATQRMRLISAAQLAAHTSASSLWVSYRGHVYDVSEFAPDHPGGDDLVLEYAGRDIEEIMEDPISHAHSASAFEILREHLVGRLPATPEEHAALADAKSGGADFSGKDADIVITADFHPDATDVSGDYEKHAFLDLNRPLLAQVWNAKFTKEFYLQQVHSPRHLKESARLFQSDFLEMFTRTPWYVVPLVWAPIAAALFHRSASQFAAQAAARLGAASTASAAAAPAASSAVASGLHSVLGAKAASHLIASPSVAITTAATLNTSMCFAAGVVVWTMLEYLLHRFLFHVDDFLPDRPFFLMLHFLLHGIHHYLPMDRLRLVMPPLLFFVLEWPFTRLAYALFPVAVANGIISGAFGMYVVYDVMHYSLHHHRLPQYLREMKAYHLAHHYKNYEEGFGVTSKIWDWVFGTQL